MLKKYWRRERAAACRIRGPPALPSRSLRALTDPYLQGVPSLAATAERVQQRQALFLGDAPPRPTGAKYYLVYTLPRCERITIGAITNMVLINVQGGRPLKPYRTVAMTPSPKDPPPAPRSVLTHHTRQPAAALPAPVRRCRPVR
jgi:hypothetical protein|eukprot:899340-Prymnesium_polylepis.2